ncbi:gfo/Idh/MocA family oxidoreductase, partial [Paenibacillus phytohabitans]
ILRLEDDPVNNLIIQYKNGEVVKYELGGIQTNEDGGQSNSHVISHFVQSIVTDTNPAVPGEEGMKSLQVILAAIESKETNKIISIN